MTSNVDIVRRAFEAAIRRPEPDYAVVNELFDPGHEYVSRTDVFEGGSRVGSRGYREWRQESDEVAEYSTRVEEVTEIDGERVLAIVPTSFTFKLSGLRLEDQRFASVVTLRGGKIVRTEVYDSREDALKAIAG